MYSLYYWVHNISLRGKKITNNNTHKQITTGLLNPSKDSVFQQLFTNPNPQSEEALKCFLEAILQEQISNIEIQREELHIEDS